jgi:hypothetical protein
MLPAGTRLGRLDLGVEGEVRRFRYLHLTSLKGGFGASTTSSSTSIEDSACSGWAGAGEFGGEISVTFCPSSRQWILASEIVR